MATAFFRTVILYLLLIAGLRITGKRQIGELEPIELVLTMLLSDLASVPMQDFGIPLVNGIVPIVTLLSLSMLLSYGSLRSVRFRTLLCGEPTLIIRSGHILQDAMRRNRLTVDELLDMIRRRKFHHYGTAYFQFVFRAIERGCRTLYVTDLDGTLLRNDGTISPETAQTLNRLISRGMLISAATARGLVGVEMIPLSAIHFRLPVVLMGGALLYDPGRRRIVHACEMNAETVGRILDAFSAAGRTPMLFRRRGNEIHVYYTRVTPAEEAFIHRKGADGRSFDRFFHHVGQLKSSPAVFFSCQGSYADQTALKAHLDSIPGIRIDLYADTYQTDAWFLEISREDAGKDQGVERLRRRIRAKRVVAFGDNRNDIPLFRTADLAVCVENAAPEAREAADMVIGSNETDGVARYLYSIYNRKV